MLGTNSNENITNPNISNILAPGHHKTLNNAPSPVSELANTPEINANFFILLSVKLSLLLWLFGYAPFFKVIAGLHFYFANNNFMCFFFDFN